MNIFNILYKTVCARKHAICIHKPVYLGHKNIISILVCNLIEMVDILSQHPAVMGDFRVTLQWCHNGSDSVTSLTIVFSTVYSDADQLKHQSSASLAFVWGIHRVPVNSSHKCPVTRKMFPFDDVIMAHGALIVYHKQWLIPVFDPIKCVPSASSLMVLIAEMWKVIKLRP